MPMMRFISPVDPMWLSTMRAIEQRLIEDTLARRYEAERTQVDGLPGPVQHGGRETAMTMSQFRFRTMYRTPKAWCNACSAERQSDRVFTRAASRTGRLNPGSSELPLVRLLRS
jgi:hypothetical protein